MAINLAIFFYIIGNCIYKINNNYKLKKLDSSSNINIKLIINYYNNLL